MKQFKFILLFTLLMSMAGPKALAYEFVKDGIYYDWDYRLGKLGFKVTYISVIEQGSEYESNYSGSINIPSSVSYYGSNYPVISIGEYAFYNCVNLTSLTIPNSVVFIGRGAFQGCINLTSINIPSSVQEIEPQAFDSQEIPPYYLSIKITDLTAWLNIENSDGIGRAYCLYLNNSLLTELNIPEGITSIKDYAFVNCCEIESIIISEGVTSIGQYAFSVNPEGSGTLNRVTIPNSVEFIGYNAFYGWSWSLNIHISDLSSWCNISDNYSGLHTGNPRLFLNDNEITSLVIPDGVTNINASVFSNFNRITSVEISSSVISIGNDAFEGCTGITELAIPNGVTSIGDDAFYGCSGLTTITMENSVTSIGNFSFYGCTALTSIISKIESPFAFGNSAFSNISSSCVLTVPVGTKVDYISAGWTKSIFGGGIVQSGHVSVAMETGSGSPRTMIGYSSQYSLDFTSITDVKAYIAIGFTDTKNVILARTYVVPANTGIVLKTDDAGIEVDVPITTSNVYYANLLHPAVDNVTIQPSETIDDVDYTNMMVGTLTNGQMGFVTFSTPKAYSNKSYLRIPTEFYESAASAREGGMEVVFAESETTDNICLIRNNSISNDAYYDLQGRKVIPNKKGFYIRNGKKVLIK